ncbi:alpha-ketoglutarate-dependent dioxygenase AlkB [Adhaeribacter sp. BT258]|uniref:Alpha-ketoglutarate-dependent dioxygenase AlkB n=1 Tax=Adhaeribacter terrigena TaxID=2793070 RepID=A0ABS1C3C4_9BACT|nr:alpha-ketoglutarate-dependent dioxygenase AlkB [Adhaeribacter terrigena]MBK0403055.1 alpha-ketoglutarate-dependent dioxygenase AlkB [Adhaeribacter terrigena]
MQLGFFHTEEPKVNLPAINGLEYMPKFISKPEHESLLKKIDSEPWLLDLKRRVQHYGYKYDYQKRSIDPSMKVGELPEWALDIGSRMYNYGILSFMPDQVIVNEYEPCQGIAQHIDCEPCFENTIVSLSLGSSCLMDFYPKNDLKQKESLHLEPQSLLVLRGEARYNWLHGIAGRKSDLINGIKHSRKRRVSLTFRKVILI